MYAWNVMPPRVTIYQRFKREKTSVLGMHRGKETICLHFSKANLRVNNDNETHENTCK